MFRIYAYIFKSNVFPNLRTDSNFLAIFFTKKSEGKYMSHVVDAIGDKFADGFEFACNFSFKKKAGGRYMFHVVDTIGVKFADEFNPSRQVFLCVYICSYLYTFIHVYIHVYIYVKIGYISNLLMSSTLRARHVYTHMYTSNVTHMNKTCHTYERDVSHI